MAPKKTKLRRSQFLKKRGGGVRPGIIMITDLMFFCFFWPLPLLHQLSGCTFFFVKTHVKKPKLYRFAKFYLRQWFLGGSLECNLIGRGLGEQLLLILNIHKYHICRCRLPEPQLYPSCSYTLTNVCSFVLISKREQKWYLKKKTFCANKLDGMGPDPPPTSSTNL